MKLSSVLAQGWLEPLILIPPRRVPAAATLSSAKDRTSLCLAYRLAYPLSRYLCHRLLVSRMLRKLPEHNLSQWPLNQ